MEKKDMALKRKFVRSEKNVHYIERMKGKERERAHPIKHNKQNVSFS